MSLEGILLVCNHCRRVRYCTHSCKYTVVEREKALGPPEFLNMSPNRAPSRVGSQKRASPVPSARSDPRPLTHDPVPGLLHPAPSANANANANAMLLLCHILPPPSVRPVSQIIFTPPPLLLRPLLLSSSLFLHHRLRCCMIIEV